ncbi:unnamed protein product [Vicia faba]|uniref:Uncharacterized protein n=1 Tax=Vicia faba TaxID=3906 RepID=A0AAV0ZD32_VICFA|nr:unnamed protein product [Vicia faba]
MPALILLIFQKQILSLENLTVETTNARGGGEVLTAAAGEASRRRRREISSFENFSYHRVRFCLRSLNLQLIFKENQIIAQDLQKFF